MFPSLPAIVQEELAQLSQQYKTPLVRTVDLGTTSQFDPLGRTDRYGEVCMVVRRPNGRLLTMVKTFYPQNAYRLLTGGINHGERVLDALLRETHEETGLQVKVTRFLTAVAYLANSSERPVFYTFAFLLDEISGTLGAIDESERVEDFREVEPTALPTMAEYLESLRHNISKEIAGDWHDWGRFRAVIHHAVWEALTTA